MQFELQLLGTNAAFPTLERFPSAQVLSVGNRAYLVDCGEGTIIRIQQFKVAMRRVGQIFISHLHGDHCFGLAGVISSLALGGRKTPMQVFGPAGLKEMIAVQLKITDSHSPFSLEFIEVNTMQHRLIFQDENVEVFSLPLLHRIPCVGYFFRERERPRNMRVDKIQEYQLDVQQILAAKAGQDLILADGQTVANLEITQAPQAPRSYAYCSDTAFLATLPELIQEVDILYHESTFLQADAQRAEETGHSTTVQAATIASVAKAKRLVLGHFSVRYSNMNAFLEEASAIFPNTIMGYDGLIIEA
jgi:ribonuclease Z